MWFFNSPEIVHGEGALDYLSEIQGKRAFIVTDEVLVGLGFADMVREALGKAQIESQVFAEVEPNPSLDTVRRGSKAMSDYGPDWVVGLGGGSCMDAAKAMWVLYERPDMAPDQINPIERLGLRQKARLITIPTTTGTGAEVSWAIVLTDMVEKRKIVLGSRENMADLAVVDPVFIAELPPGITADTGMDALTHAVECYVSTWRNVYADGLCLEALRLIFTYLVRAYENGAADPEARQGMQNAATIAGLALNNSMATLAHALGHPLSPHFGVPHGRAMGLFLPYTIEFAAKECAPLYANIARFMGWPAESDEEGTASLVKAIRNIAERMGQPASLRELGIEQQALEEAMPTMIEQGENDTVTSMRIPDREEMAQLYRYAFEGKPVDF
ncbi:MAG: iron-containing alcohol dehydrogenase [Anaerolineae bacterium]